MTSTGLWMLAVAGRSFLSLPRVTSLNWASFNPWRTAASVAMTPGPPALVTMAMRLPLGTGWEPKAWA